MRDLTVEIAASDLRPRRRPVLELDQQAWGEALGAIAGERLNGLLLADESPPVALTALQRSELRDLHRESMTRCLRLDHLLLEAADLLAAASVDFRLLKGIAHAAVLYPDPAMRPYVDVDLLVPGDDFGRTLDVLAKIGLERREAELRPGFDRRFGKGATLTRSDGLSLDLHRTFVAGPYAVLIEPRVLFRDPVLVPIGAERLPALGPEARLLHACFHAAISDHEPSLIAQRDVAAAALHPDVDFDVVRDLGERWQAEAVIAHAVRHAWQVLEPERDNRLTRWAGEHRASGEQRRLMAAYAGTSRRWARQAAATLPVIDGIRPKFDFAAAVLVPSRQAVGDRRRSRSAHARRVVSVITARWPREPFSAEPVDGPGPRPHFIHRVRRWLNPIDLTYVACVGVLLVAIEAGVRWWRVDRVADVLGVAFLDEGTSGRTGQLQLTHREGRWAKNADRVLRHWPIDATCLRRSLLAGWILRRRSPALILGLRQGDSGFEAHAWIRVDGIDLEPIADRFEQFA
jgi:hypothetical protein